MYEINGMLKRDPDQHVQVESTPASWPFLNHPMRMVGEWADKTQPKYLLRKIVLPKSIGSYAMQMRGAQQCVYEIQQPPPPMLIWAVFSGFTSFLAVLIIGVIDKYGGVFKHHRLPFAIAPVGAASVLIFGVPSSPLSQPRNVIVGHMIAALIGTFMRELFLHASDSFEWMPGALAVGISIGLMGLTNCYHPPAGATAFMAGYSSPMVKRVGWWFPLYPVLPLTLILLGLGILFNNLARVYPVFWFTAAHFARQPEHGMKPVTEAVGSTAGPDGIMVDETTSTNTSALSHDMHAGLPSTSRVEDTVTHQVNDLTGNEDDAERAWMYARIRALEQEVKRLGRELGRNLTRQDRLWQWTRSLPGRPEQRRIWLPSSVKDYVARMRGAQHYRGETQPPPPMLIWAVYSGFTSFAAILVLGVISKYGKTIKDHHLPFAIAPIGASAVLVFGVPSSPLAQPRNVVVGHMIAALTGTFLHEIFKHTGESLWWLPGSLSVGISIGLMGLTNCYHPPAGATAFIAGFSTSDFARVNWWFALYPVLPQVLILVALGILFNNFSRLYPVYWFTTASFARQPTQNQITPTATVDEEEEASAADIKDDSDRSSLNSSSSSSISAQKRSSGLRQTPYSGGTMEQEVIDATGNEADAERAWMQAKIKVLESEVDRLNKNAGNNSGRHHLARHRKHQSQTWHPTYLSHDIFA
ncbi:hypothetical protein IWW48_000879 [Coemansia sp. RSA 1200]|nr:hypothetical protein IWW48_000879 [Coemansia sp. RSA 1200]